VKTSIDQLIENASSLSALEEAEHTRQAILKGGMVVLVTSSLEEAHFETPGKVAAPSVSDVWKPFVIERNTEPAEKSIEKPMGSTTQTPIRTLARKLPGPFQKFLGVSPDQEMQIEPIPETVLGRLFHWFTRYKPLNRQASATTVPKKRRTAKQRIRDGFFWLFLLFLRWMAQRTIKNIKKYL